MNRKLYAFIPAAIFAAGMQAADLPRDTVNLNQVVVTPPLKTNPDLIPLNVTQVSSAQIEKSGETSLLPVLVSKVPGLFVTERGFAGYGVSGGSAGAVNIRGIGQGNKVLFMIDGQPQWAGVFGHSVADTYVANGIERVEVVKGPSSLLYGSNAMGGSINLITHVQRTDGFQGRARAMFGSFSTQKYAVSTGYKGGKLSATLSGQYDRSNGYRERSSFWLANEFTQIKYAATKNWSVAGMLDLTQTRANYPGTTQAPLENMWTEMFRGTGGIYLKNTYDKFDGGFQGYINWGKHNVDDGNNPKEAPRDYLFHSTDYNMGLTAYESFYLWEANTLSAGIDFQHWGGHIWNTNKEDKALRSSESTHHVNEIAGYVMMQQGFLDDFLNINGGVRIQHGSAYGNVFVPQFGAIVKPWEASTFKLSFSKGFRAPNIRELYLYPPANPDLRPEYMYNYELSYRQHLFDYNLMVGASLFYIDAKNMIQTAFEGGRPHNVNTGRFHNRGFEIEVGYNILPGLQAGGSWSYLYSDSDNLYTPRNKVNLEVNYSKDNFQFTLENMNIWSMDIGDPDAKNESYSLLNLRGAYTLTLSTPLTFSLKLDNLTNKHYEIIYGCPMPGFTVMGGVEVKF